MSFIRPMVQDTGMQKVGRAGDGWIEMVAETVQNTDSNQVLGASAMAAGLYTRGGMTAGRTDTTDTAVNILASLAQMDVGDTNLFYISVQVAFALTLAAGTGVTLSGKTVVPASGAAFFLLTKTSGTTVTIKGL